MALAAACVGGWLGRAADARTGRRRCARAARLAAAVAIFALVGLRAALDGRPQGVRADRTLHARRRRHRRNAVAVRVDPPSGADDANWLTATSWQGGGPRRRPLGARAPGVYRSTRPLPLTGEWKTMIRLHRGRALTALPVYLPADPAIPVEGIPARARVRPRVRAASRRSCSASARPRPAGSGAPPTRPCWRSRSAFLVALAWGVHRVSRPDRDPSARASLGSRVVRACSRSVSKLEPPPSAAGRRAPARP